MQFRVKSRPSELMDFIFNPKMLILIFRLLRIYSLGYFCVWAELQQITAQVYGKVYFDMTAQV